MNLLGFGLLITLVLAGFFWQLLAMNRELHRNTLARTRMMVAIIEENLVNADLAATTIVSKNIKPGWNLFSQAQDVQLHPLAVVDHVHHWGGGGELFLVVGALLRAALAVQHVGAGDFMVLAAHQAQLDLVLHIFNMEGAAARTRAHQGADHVLGERVHHLAHAGRGGALRAVHCQKRLHHRHCNFLGLERHHRAVAANDLVVRERVPGSCGRCSVCGGIRRGGGRWGRRVQSSLHGCPLVWAVWGGMRPGAPPQCVGAAPDFSLAHTIYGVSRRFKTLPVVYRRNEPPKPKQHVPNPVALAIGTCGEPL